MTRYIKKTPFIAAFIAVLSMVCVSLLGFHLASASPVTGFSAGNIISDNIFTNSQSMTASQIQQFLNSKVSSCDTNGTQPASEYGRSDLTHAQYAASRGWAAPPYTCLKSYSEGGKVAAQIIYDIAQTYQINPQVFIVLLQKEQGLVTDSWPLSTQYRTATGYGCPDTAPCDSQYYGLTNQLTWSAKMFRAIMNDSPTWYTPYELGNNYIQYNPNSSCGGSTVNILNRATQALYNYTPYQPNQSALNAGYGSGDSCGAYGNRNFYLYFSDWFGSTLYGNLVRTTTDATVYLISGDTKYPINNLSTLTIFSDALGPVSYVPSSYLSSKTTGITATNLIKSNESASVYFVNAGIRLAFTNCTIAAHYARPCGSEVTLTAGQVNQFASGPNMTQLYQTTSGIKYYIDSSTKREVFDQLSQSNASITGSYNVLNDSGISHLPVGVPIIRDNVIVKASSSNKNYLFQSNKMIYLPTDIKQSTVFSSLPTGSLADDSVAQVAQGGTLNGFIKDGTGNKYVIDSSGKALLTDPNSWTTSFTTLDTTFINAIPNSSQSVNSKFIKSSGGRSIYQVIGAKRYSIASWDDFLNLHQSRSDEWASLMGTTVDSIPNGGITYPAGTLIKTANSASVYVITGSLQKTPLASFSTSRDYGLSGVRSVSQTSLDASITTGMNLNNFIVCNSKKYLANRGVVYEITTTANTVFGYSGTVGTTWGDVSCSNLPISSTPLDNYEFIKREDSNTIYYVSGGQKHPVSSMSKYLDLGGSSSNLLIVSDGVVNQISDGATI